MASKHYPTGIYVERLRRAIARYGSMPGSARFAISTRFSDISLESNFSSSTMTTSRRGLLKMGRSPRDDCIRGMAATNSELASPHLRAGVLGFQAGSRYDELIDQAFKYSLNRSILMGEKTSFRGKPTSSILGVEAQKSGSQQATAPSPFACTNARPFRLLWPSARPDHLFDFGRKIRNSWCFCTPVLSSGRCIVDDFDSELEIGQSILASNS